MKKIKTIISLLKYFQDNKAAVAIIILLMLCGVVAGIIMPYFIQRLIDDAIIKKNVGLAFNYCIIILIINIAFSVFTYIQNYLSYKFSCEYGFYLKQKFLEKLFLLHYSCIKNKTFGNLLTLFGNDIDNIASFGQTIIFGVVANFVQLTAWSFYFYYISPKLAMISLITLLIHYVIVKVSSRFFDTTARLLRKIRIDVNNFIYDRLYNIFYVKILCREDYELKIYKEKYRNSLETSYKITKITMAIEELKGFMSFLGCMMVILYGALLVADDQITIGGLLAANNLFILLYSPASFFINLKLDFYKIAVSYQKINEILSCKDIETEGITIGEINKIEVNGLKFKFNNNIILFNEFTANFNIGEITLIKGANGSGKTTLALLLYGFYKEMLDNGIIKFNDYDIKNINISSLRSKVGFFPQKIEILSGTLKNFIISENIDYETKIEQINNMGLHRLFIEKGVDYQVMRTGENLSGGEKQRLYLAALIARKYDFYIFDEFESSQDGVNRELFKNIIIELKKLCKGIIIITHSNDFDKLSDKTIQI